MTSLSQIQIQKLLENGSKNEFSIYLIPVAKIFVKNRNETWLLTDINPEDPSIVWGICMSDDHFSFLSHIYVNSEFEVDHTFKANFTAQTYMDAEDHYGELIYDDNILRNFVTEVFEPTQYKLF